MPINCSKKGTVRKWNSKWVNVSLIIGWMLNNLNMLAITSLFLAGFIQKQLDFYFTESHKAELENKILEMKKTIEQLVPEIIKVDPNQKNKLDEWKENSVLKDSLHKLEEKKNSEKTNEIVDIILKLKIIVRDLEEFFEGKTIAIADWNINKYYLENVLSLLKNESADEILTSEKIIGILNLLPLNQCTSELGYYKQFARGIDEDGKSFTNIFYLLKSGETSYFHKLDTTETWIWLGKSPLSLFTIDNNQLIEHVLCEANQSMVIPSQTWFSAKIKIEEEHKPVENSDIPFALVTCFCTPAFTLSSYHDDIMEDEKASMSLINIYKKSDAKLQSDIIELVVPKYRENFKQKIQ